jgi:hypothetical protein
MKIHPVGAELFHADVRTDVNLIVSFRSFANALKNKSEKMGRNSSMGPKLCEVEILMCRIVFLAY